MADERKAKSPYQRYGKSPYRYSDAYGRWKSAVLRGDDKAASAASRAHMAYLRNSLGWTPDDAAYSANPDRFSR